MSSPNISRLTRLPNGLRVATCQMPHSETAAVGVWAAVGGRHEPAPLNGISHFIEHMLFKGTFRRSARRIMEEVEGVGGDMNAYTAEERTCYYAAAAAEFFPRLCDVLCDLYVNPKFSEKEIERERGVIGEEILMYRDEPSSHVQEMLNGTFWPRHPLGRPLTGTLETIEAFSRKDFLDYRATHYHAGNTVVTAAGDVQHDDVVERVARGLESLPTGPRTRFAKAPSPPAAPRFLVEKRDTQQTQIAIGLPGVSHLDHGRFAFQVLNLLLAGNASSRLFQELREKRGLCYSVSTHPSMFNDTGMLNLSLGLDQRNVAKSLRVILSTFTDLKERPVRPAELRRAKEYAVGTSRMALEKSSSQNGRLGGSVIVHGRIVEADEIHAEIRAVTAEDLQAAARNLLDPLRATVAVIGPSPDIDEMKALLVG